MTDHACELGPIYHDFSWLGLKTTQIEGIYAANQQAKAPVIAAYILLALARLRCRSYRRISFSELFCADGFYTLFAARFGAHESVGYDNDRDGHLETAFKVRDLLKLNNASFIKTNVEDIPSDLRYSIVANVGGLYHVNNPSKLLDFSYAMATDFLIVQNVVSLATSNPHYFAKPAPGLNWGNRFSRESFDAFIRSKDWNIIESDFNILDANPRLEDKGSVYYLIQKH